MKLSCHEILPQTYWAVCQTEMHLKTQFAFANKANSNDQSTQHSNLRFTLGLKLDSSFVEAYMQTRVKM